MIIKTNDSTKRYEKNLIFKNIQRSSLGFSQTPQGFTFSNIFEKHMDKNNESFDDDSALFTIYGEKVLAVNGSKTNLKIHKPQVTLVKFIMKLCLLCLFIYNY